MWNEDPWAMQITTRTQRWLVGSILIGLFAFAQEAPNVFLFAFPYLVVAAFGNEFVSHVIKTELLSSSRAEWIRFVYNLLTFNHLISSAHTDHFLLAALVFIPLNYQLYLVGGMRGGLFLLFSYFSSYWIGMAFLSEKLQKGTLGFSNLMAFVLVMGVSLSYKRLLDFYRAQTKVLQSRIEFLESSQQSSTDQNKAA